MPATHVVVVGAGVAGLVIATRLSQDPDVRVTVVEAGPVDWDPALDAPGFITALGLPGRIWPELLAHRRADGPPSLYVRGRGIGGSGAVNAMLMLPPDDVDYQRWSALGGWGSELAAVHHALEIRPATDDEVGPLAAALLAAHPGARRAPLGRTRDGHRSLWGAYVAPWAKRPNVRVIGDRLVERVLFDGRCATGVRCADGTEIEGTEVVLAAGAIHSPAILLRSGVDTPGVGEGLQDHPAATYPVRLRDTGAPEQLAIAAFVRASSSIGVDDLQLLGLEGTGEHASLMAAVMEVYSTGRVSLGADDAAGVAAPRVDFDMLSDERDATRLVDALAQLGEVLEHPAMRAAIDASDPDLSLEGARDRLGDYVHATSTCAMGRVVDTSCSLRGYDALHVCDASVLPSVPHVNTHLPTTMVAERFCELWRQR